MSAEPFDHLPFGPLYYNDGTRSRLARPLVLVSDDGKALLSTGFIIFEDGKVMRANNNGMKGFRFVYADDCPTCGGSGRVKIAPPKAEGGTV